MREDFKSREKILITGADKGIGRTLAVQLAREGHELLLHGSKQDSLDSLVLQLPLSGKYNILIADFASEESVLEFLNILKEEHADLTSMISNEGISIDPSLGCIFLLEVNEMLLNNQKQLNAFAKP